MDRYLLTPSLYDAYFYYSRFDFKTKEEFVDNLKRVRGDLPEAARKGIEFEDRILAYTKGEIKIEDIKPGYDDCVKEIGDIVQGGLWQETASKEIQIGGMTFVLYGRLDVVKRDWIYDIKFTGKYDIGKFREKIQHLVYMYLLDMKKFGYLISDLKDVYREDYFWEADSKSILFGELRDMMSFIMNDREFRELYLEHWKSKY